MADNICRGSLADQIGRRKSYLIVVLTIFVFSVLSAVGRR